MKAAVLHEAGTIPQYEDFPDPIPNEQQTLMTVKASSIKHLDKSKASGKHYTSYPYFPIVVGIDGTGLLENGKRVYARGETGMFAEKALIEKDHWTPLPDGIDFETAAALPNALLGSDMALLYKGKIKKGDVVVVSGATGVTGKVAVQLAKYRGASKVIVIGRSADKLEVLKSLGADEIISLKQDDEAIINQLKEIQKSTPIDIVLDYLWGHPMELILAAFKSIKPRPVRIVTIGEMAGATIPLPSAILRSTQIEILGSGIGSLPNEVIAAYLKDILPFMFQLVAEGKMKLDIERVELKDIQIAWERKADDGKRIVVKM